MKLQAIAILTFLTFANVMAQETTTTKYINSTDMEALKLTQEWDKTFPQSGTVVAQEKMQVLERIITDALQIRQYDFASLVYVRVLLELEAVKLCARNRTPEDLENIEQALIE